MEKTNEKKKAKLLWVDLEMTGLVPEKDRILEIAAIATDMNLNEIARMHAVILADSEILNTRMVGEFWEKNSETREALMKQNSEGVPIREVETGILQFLNENFADEIYLAGNSIHQDRKFIEREMPEFNRRLHYRMLDVSAWKIYFENALGRKFTKKDEHRAMSDIEGSIEELKWYLTFLK